MINLGLSLDEIEIFVHAARLKSLKEVCRQLSLQPARVTKTVQKLERKVGAKLLTRSVNGVSPTPEGAEVFRACEKIMELVPDLDVTKRKLRKLKQVEKVCGIGSISFICSRVLAPALGRWGARRTDTRFRVVEFTDNELVSHGLKGAFEIAVHIEPLSWTKVWHTQSLGRLRWALYGRSGHPLGPVCTEAQALQFPFVVPTGWTEQGFVAGEDHCPVGVPFRLRGNEAATAETALEMIQSTDQLTYVPEIMARQALLARRVQLVRVREWPETAKEIFISAQSAKVSKPLLSLIRDDLKKTIRA